MNTEPSQTILQTYHLLHLRTMTLSRVAVPAPAVRVPMPLPLPKSCASSPSVFDRITEILAMARWINGYVFYRALYDDTGSIEEQLKHARVARVTTHLDFNYQFVPSWEGDSQLCPVCMKKWPRTDFWWHQNSYSRDGLRTDACKSCRNSKENGRHQVRRILKAA